MAKCGWLYSHSSFSPYLPLIITGICRPQRRLVEGPNVVTLIDVLGGDASGVVIREVNSPKPSIVEPQKYSTTALALDLVSLALTMCCATGNP